METFCRFEPSFAEPYTWLLVAVVAVTVVRVGRLSWSLFGGVLPRRIALDRVLDGTVSPDDLARAAFASRVSHGALSADRLAQLRAGPRIDLEKPLRTLHVADARFDDRWRRLATGVSATRSLIRLTLIAATLSAAYAFLPKWEYFVAVNARYPSLAGVMGLFEASHWTLVRLSLGFGVAGGLSVVAVVFDGLLQHRLAAWKYLYATARDALADGDPLE
jgi:hypothetical protein